MGVGEGKIYRVSDLIQIVMHVFSRTKQDTLITFSRLINPVVQFWQEQNENANITSGDNAWSKNLWFSSKAGTWFLERPSLELLHYSSRQEDRFSDIWGDVFEGIYNWVLTITLSNSKSIKPFEVFNSNEKGSRKETNSSLIFLIFLNFFDELI